MRYAAALLVLLPVAWLGTPAVFTDNEPVEIAEWEVPFRMDSDGILYDEPPTSNRERTRPRDAYVDSHGRVWFCGQAGNYIAYLDPNTGSFKRFALDDGTHPHNLIIDEQDFIWYAGNRDSHIGRLDPNTGEIKKFMMPDPSVRDPHTLIWDQNGDIWFTAQQSNAIGKLTVATGEIQLIKVPTDRARPYGIVIDSKNRPWIALFGTNTIGMVDENMELKTYPLTDEAARPRRLAVTSDDMVWYVDYARGFLGRLNPTTGEVDEWQAPGSAESRPYAMAVDDDDRLWFVESPNRQSRLVGFDSKTLEYFSTTEIESGGLTVRHMVFHQPSRTIWFGTDANTIGRANIPKRDTPVD